MRDGLRRAHVLQRSVHRCGHMLVVKVVRAVSAPRLLEVLPHIPLHLRHQRRHGEPEPHLLRDLDIPPVTNLQSYHDCDQIFAVDAIHPVPCIHLFMQQKTLGKLTLGCANVCIKLFCMLRRAPSGRSLTASLEPQTLQVEPAFSDYQ